MRRAVLLTVWCLLATGCGADHGRHGTSAGQPAAMTQTPDLPVCLGADPTATHCVDGEPTPPPVPDGPEPKGKHAMAGERVFTRAGCLACHKLGESGNSGPGPDLSHIGRQLTRRQLRRTLLHPIAPMPSYRSLPKRQLRNLIGYLRQLR